MHEKLIEDLTHNNVIDIFKLGNIPNKDRAGKQTEEELEELAKEYEFDAFRNLQ